MDHKFYRKVLKNGMTVIFEKRDIPVVTVIFSVRMGGINESESEKGISHFIEHMLYKGTPTRDSNQKVAEEIEKKGGILNGFTSEETTAYWCKMPSKHLNVALDVLGDIIKNPLFDKKEMEKERQVIFEELKMRKDTPRIYVFDEIQKAMFTGTLSMDSIGTFETMNSINREKIVKKFKETYNPNNLILCVVGDADFDNVVNFAEKNFGTGKGEIQKQEFKTRNQERIEKRKGIDQANLVFAYHVPKATEKKSHVARILSTLMAEGMSSRLFIEIREKRNLIYSIKGHSDINKNFAYNAIYFGCKKEKVDKVKELILEEFKKVSKDLTEKELNQTKEQLIGNHQISMEDSEEQAVNLLAYEIQGNAEEFYNFEKNISNVKLDDVKELAGRVKEGNYSFFALIPEEN